MRILFLLGLVGVAIFGPAVCRAQEPNPALVATSPSLLTPEIQKELFDALDLSSDALKPVAAAVAKGDYTAAEHELAEYYRHRTNPAWKFDPPLNPAVKDPIAEAAVMGSVKGGDILPFHTFPDNKIDWFFNATYNVPGVTPNYGWQEQLCRMNFWSNLADSYRATRDERYTKAWLDQFHSFAAECPLPDFQKHPPVYEIAPVGKIMVAPLDWRGLDTGIRIGSTWPNAFFSFLPSSQFTDQDVALYLYYFMGTARYLQQYNSKEGNGITMEMTGLYTVGAYFPEFKEAKSWREYAGTRMAGVESSQFLPDGAMYELSTMYHNVELFNFLFLADVARRVGRLAELPPSYIPGLEKAFDFDLYILTPDQKFPEFNDSLSFHLHDQFIMALPYFPDRPEYQWIASQGKEGHPPAETSHEFSWAGFYVMRSGWDKDANYLVFRAGPLGVSHAHQDKLNVILWPYGRQVLFNSGGATYEKSKWRDYSTQTFSKNTVLVDGKPQNRDAKNFDGNSSKVPIDARWESTPDHDFASGVYDEGYGQVGARVATHTRRVLFVKPDLFVIADTLAPIDAAEHTYQARWNLLTTKTQEDPVTHAVTTIDENQPNLVLLPLQPDHLEVRSASAQTDPELLGWNVRHAGQPAHVPATTVLHTKVGAGVQSFLTLLIPLRTGAASPVAAVQATGADSAVVTFTDGRKLTIDANPDPSGGMEVVETLANGTEGRHVKIPDRSLSPHTASAPSATP